MAAPKTVATYDLNGSTREFDFAFDYLARSFVKVSLIGTERVVLQVGTDYTFVSANRIRTNVIYGAPDYQQIEIRRETSTTDRLVDFQDASILRADDLDLSQLQVLHVAEEAREAATETLGVNNFGHVDARGRRIVNVADPVDLGDVVTLRFYEGDVDGARAARTASEAARDKSREWATKMGSAVEGTEFSARHYASESAGQAILSAASATVANQHRANAELAKLKAQEWATKATAVEGTDQSAKTYAGQAAASASASADSASSSASQVSLAAAQVGLATDQANLSKDWATKGTAVADGLQSSRTYATQAQGHANAAEASKNQAVTQADRAESEADRAYSSAQTVNGPWLTAQVANPTGMQTVNGGQVGYRNVVINGAMDVAQIASTASVPDSGGFARVVDCWATTRNGVGAMQATNPVISANQPYPTGGRVERFAKCLNVTMQATPTITSGSYAGAQTNIEGYDIRRFFGRTFTVSFWVRASKAGTYPLAIRNGAANRSFIGSYTVNTASTWERKSVTVTGGIPTSLAAQFDAGNGRGLQLVWGIACGATYQTATGNTWLSGNYLQLTTHNQVMRANGDYFQITGVQCEAGEVATDFEHEPISTTLARLSRYVQVFWEVPVSSISSANASWGGFWGRLQYPVPMRVAPTALTTTMAAGSTMPLDALAIHADTAGFRWAGTGTVPNGMYGMFTVVLSALFD